MVSSVLPALRDALTQPAPVHRETPVPLAWPAKLVPNFSDWQLGDVVLVHGGNDFRGKGIRITQILSTHRGMRVGRACTHAGIYVGNGAMVDATPANGVAERSVGDYCQSRALQVRRLADMSIPNADVLDIAAQALKLVGQPYSMVAAVGAKLWPGTSPNPGALYCSTLVGVAVARATGLDLARDPANRPLYPAVLAVHKELRDVALEWRRI